MHFLSVILLFFLSGFLVIRSAFGRKAPLSSFETLVFSFALGVAVLDFSMIGLGELHVRFTAGTMLLAFLAVPATLFVIRYALESFAARKGRRLLSVETDRAFSPSRAESLAFFLIIASTILLRTIFLSDAGLPTSTDLGHHMYWSKQITETGALPEYAKREIITLDGRSTLSEPQPISDFIIGEHLPFAAVSILSGESLISAFPVNFLSLVNLLSLLSLMALSVRFSENILSGKKGPTPFSVGLGVLFLSGPLFAFSSPEAKFVSGGVVGNLFGNLLIPLVLLSFFRALRDKDSRFLGIGIFLAFALAYTHHLSSLVLALILTGILFSLFLLFRREIIPLARRIARLFLSPYPIFALAFAAAFFFLAAMPTYIETNAAGTALGTPSKATREGLTFLQASDSAGTARMAIGIAALVAAFFIRGIRNSSAFAFVLGWTAALIAATLAPHFLLLDIPSNRIGSYLSFPVTLLSGVFVATIPFLLRPTGPNARPTLVPGRLLLFSMLVLFAFVSWNGSADNRSSLPAPGKAREAAEIFRASSYLAERAEPDDLFLKDHNYLPADSWMKLFFMRGYDYPLSRGFFKRYEDETKPREQCTLLMISTPNLADGIRCYEDLGVNLIAVNPTYDAAQFEKSSSFSRIYAGDLIHVYERR